MGLVIYGQTSRSDLGSKRLGTGFSAAQSKKKEIFLFFFMKVLIALCTVTLSSASLSGKVSTLSSAASRANERSLVSTSVLICLFFSLFLGGTRVVRYIN